MGKREKSGYVVCGDCIGNDRSCWVFRRKLGAMPNCKRCGEPYEGAESDAGSRGIDGKVGTGGSDDSDKVKKILELAVNGESEAAVQLARELARAEQAKEKPKERTVAAVEAEKDKAKRHVEALLRQQVEQQDKLAKTEKLLGEAMGKEEALEEEYQGLLKKAIKPAEPQKEEEKEVDEIVKNLEPEDQQKFQRKMEEKLGMKNTYVDRANTNASVLEVANRHKNHEEIVGKNVMLFGEYLKARQCQPLAHIVGADNQDPLRQCTLEPGALTPRTLVNRRVGGPRIQWTWATYKELLIRNGLFEEEPWKRRCKIEEIKKLAEGI